MRPPWWCCFGWSPRSLVCLADNTLHAVLGRLRDAEALPGPLGRVCAAHDRLITEEVR